MTRIAPHSQTCASEPHCGTGTRTGRRPPGIEYFGDFDAWPERHELRHVNPYHDAAEKAALFEADQDACLSQLLPKTKALGDDTDAPGALQTYAVHRAAERLTADYYFYTLAPFAEAAQRFDLANKFRRIAVKMYQCRTGGPFGMGASGRAVIAWESKCGCSKLCPDEARHESQRLYDRYVDAIRAHVAAGGRVYKAWPTLPNYPPGRLREGMRHIFKRFRDKVIRAQLNKKNKFGIAGALSILENPLSSSGDWNVHLNCILLADGWLSYKALRDAWGCNIEVRQHSDFTEKGLKGLFNEMVKYAVRTVPEKSSNKRGTQAPAMIEWGPELGIEWHEATHGFRRTRAYGSLHGIGKPESDYSMPRVWVGRVDYHTDGYRITRRKHNLGHLAGELLRTPGLGLDLIRGDKSTTRHARAGPGRQKRGPAEANAATGRATTAGRGFN